MHSEKRAWDYHFPTDPQMVDAIAQVLGLSADDLLDGRRMRRVNHVVQMVQLYHRQARSIGETSGFKKRAAVAAALWPDVACQGDMKRKLKQLLTWERIAEAAGLLRVWDGRGARALGWELLEGWQQYAGGPRGYSSVGRATATRDRHTIQGGAVQSPDASCEARRRPENRRERDERRVRPHCRRVGNKTGAVGRLLPPEPPSSKRRKKSHPWGLGKTPKGASPTFALHDTHARRGRPTAGAAPIGETASYEQRHREAELLFAKAFGPPAGGRLTLVGPLLAALDELDRAFAQMAELNGWAVQTDAALAYLDQLLGGEATMRREEGRRPPRHLGFFVKPLLAEARRVHRKRRDRQRAAQPPARPATPPAKEEPRPSSPAERAIDRLLREAQRYDQRARANPRWADAYRAEAQRLRQEARARAELESHPPHRTGSDAPRSDR